MAESENNKLIKGVHINDIYDFVDNGDPGDTPPEIALYFVLMEKVRQLHSRVLDFGTKTSIINHLVKVEGLTRHIAEKVYYDALEYYNASNRLSKQAQRNVYADKIDRQIAIFEPFVKEIKDSKELVAMIEKAAKIRQLDKEEVDVIPEEWLKKTWNLYTTDALEAGLEPINSNELARIIDSLPDITNKERKQIAMEAAQMTIEVFPNDEKNPRKEG